MKGYVVQSTWEDYPEGFDSNVEAIFFTREAAEVFAAEFEEGEPSPFLLGVEIIERELREK